jgi:hypothetical protein
MNKKLNELLDLCRNSFSDNEIEEVKEFIDVNENKLALETICAIFYEEKKMVTQEQLDLIKSIGGNMTISPKKWERLDLLN